MRNKTVSARAARRLVAACAAALLVLALAPGVALAADRAPAPSADSQVAPAVAGTDGPWGGLWSALADAWNDLGRLFAAESGGGSGGGEPTGGEGDPKCETDCGVDIDPNG
jgi:carbohydrate-selective porin OprB